MNQEYERNQNIATPAGHNYANTTNWDRSSLLSFILQRKFKLQCFTIGHYELPRFQKSRVVRNLMDVMDHKLNRFFVSNASHVWCVKRHEDTWYCLDSMRGKPIPTNLEKWENKSYTLTFPWTEERCRQGIYEMQKLVRREFLNMTSRQICALVMQDLMQREPSHFGDCQNWIAHFYRFLHITNPAHYDKQVARFRDYENCSKLDILNAMNNLPDIIMFIVHYK